jgi:uncharacterized protein YqhQ
MPEAPSQSSSPTLVTSADGGEPRYVGGQAVLEGVMMRGATTWAVSVRLPDGTIETEVHDAPQSAEKYRKVPLVRGVATLVESMVLGFKALTWSADKAIAAEEARIRDEEAAEAAAAVARGEAPKPTKPVKAKKAKKAAESGAVHDIEAGAGDGELGGVSKVAMRISMVIGIVFFVGLFMIVPGLISHALTDSGTSFNVVDGVVKLSFFIAYLGLIGLLPDIKRVFQYHGAEHKAIAAYENEVELTPSTAQQFTTEHVRCGTSFLLVVMVVSIASHLLFGRPGVVGIIFTRILMVLPVAGVSYEAIRFMAKNQRFRVVRWISRPGRLLQKLTTREPTLDQLEVAIVSLKAVLAPDDLAAVESRTETVPANNWGLRRRQPADVAA